MTPDEPTSTKGSFPETGPPEAPERRTQVTESPSLNDRVTALEATLAEILSTLKNRTRDHEELYDGLSKAHTDIGALRVSIDNLAMRHPPAPRNCPKCRRMLPNRANLRACPTCQEVL